MTGGHTLEAVVTFLHGALHQQGARGSVGATDDGAHVWMSYHTPEGRIHELHVAAIVERGAPRLAARHLIADTPSDAALQVGAWLREHGRG